MAMISLRCTDKEKKKLENEAKKREISLSQFIIQTCLKELERKQERNLVTPTTTYNMQTLLNLLECGAIKKGDFIEHMRRELSVWLQW